jgi:hypothetical protein
MRRLGGTGVADVHRDRVARFFGTTNQYGENYTKMTTKCTKITTKYTKLP